MKNIPDDVLEDLYTLKEDTRFQRLQEILRAQIQELKDENSIMKSSLPPEYEARMNTHNKGVMYGLASAVSKLVEVKQEIEKRNKFKEKAQSGLRTPREQKVVKKGRR